MKRVLLIAALGFTVAASAGAQRGPRQCAIPIENCSNCLWLDDRIDSATPGRMRNRLVGMWDLMVVQTEGRPEKSVSLSELIIHPWPDYDTTHAMGKITRMIAYGTLRNIQSGLVTDSALKAAPQRSPEFLRVIYGGPDQLFLKAAGDSAKLAHSIMDEGGPLLEAMDFDDDRLSGRWVEGGIVAMAYPTPVGDLIEQDRGYFCAWKRR